MQLDFAALADGLRRNNVGVGGFTLEVRARFEDGVVVLEPSGQRFPFDGQPPDDGTDWRALIVRGWNAGERTTLQLSP